MLLTVVNLSTVDSARDLFKKNDAFMRILKVVGGMHRNTSLKGTADTAYQNITKNTQIKAPTIEVEKSVHKYTRSNTIAFYSSCVGMGLGYGLAWALRGNMLYGGLKGAALVSKTVSNALGTASGTILLGGFMRDAQALATSPVIRKYTEADTLTHSGYTVAKVAYLGVGAFVINAAFPHIFVPSVMANMCLGSVIKGSNDVQAWLERRRATKETPQKKLA